ncbi:MAG: type II secretion system F family protein [Candidatus Brennerbacteria bacterium]|nr:type II secretion system F family protein [Candidatus Brennerbacteria bacterium]
MPRFFYAAQDKQGVLTKGDTQAPSREEAINNLMKRGLTPVKIELAADQAAAGRLSSVSKMQISFGRRLTMFDQIIFIRHLGTVLKSGTDILTGFDIIAQDAIKPLVRKIAYDMKDRLGRGESLSDAIKHWQNHFNPIFINLVKAGESSGNLPDILLAYARELRKDYTFVRKLRGAMVYPAILITALGAMLIIVLSVVAPKLKELFTSLKAEPPFYTKIFFITSDLWLNYTVPIIIGASLLVFFILMSFRLKKIRLIAGSLLWHLPILNKMQKNLSLMRFSKTTAHLLQAGFSLKGALTTASEIMSQKYQNAILNIQKKLEQGIGFAEALREHPDLFPGILVSVVATGEKSGQLISVLEQMSEFYEEEIIYSLELLLTVIEPVLLLIVGVVVGLLASSLISPIYRLVGSI